ncbi:DUF6534 domain-containing protein [Sporobolomyces salmoneus]|uniref:DUF6534 domain-containing protein n=1 Tax=Sporobolomyces salmoneus TaxID=183962 RepID=UPI003178C4A6
MGLLDGSIGPFIIGTVVACFLSGVTTVQAFYYMENFPKDRALYKYLVLGLFVLDMTHTAICIVTIWDWCVANYGDVEHLLVSPWSFAVDPVIVGVIAATCQTFYAYRVWIVGKRKWLLPICILTLSAVSLGFAIASTVQIFHLKEFGRFQEFTYGVAIWLAGSAAADVLITASLVFYLSSSKTGLNGTNSILNRIIELTVSTNGLTCSVAILDAILFATMDNSAHVSPNLALPKLYFNSLLVSLNARVALEKRMVKSHSGNESHGLAEFSIAGGAFPLQARGGKIASPISSRPADGGRYNGIQVTTHRSVIADEALHSSTYLPSSTISEKELPFYSSPVEKEQEAGNYHGDAVHPFAVGGEDRASRSPGGSV